MASTSSSSSSPNSIPLGSCAHLNSFKLSLNAANPNSCAQFYSNLMRSLLTPSSCAARANRAQALSCHTCGVFEGRIHACLHCIHFACYPDHLARHRHKNRSHILSLESTLGNIHCAACNDFVYDPELDQVAETCLRKASRSLGMGSSPFAMAWRPSTEEVALLRRHRKRKSLGSMTSTIGLRGLVNLGNTCFMSCIVQSLIHTPLLRDYFLSDRHICMLEDGPEQCIVCEMSRLFQVRF